MPTRKRDVKSVRALKDIPIPVFINDSDQYDTDLEITPEGPDDKAVKDYYIGATTYRKACEFMEIIPQSAIMNSLSGNEINIKNRTLGPKGIRAIAAALKRNTTIQVLNLEGNTIEGEGVQDITQMLIENDFITHANLSRNRLGTKHSVVNGPYFISDMMRKNNGITHLNLSGNDFSESDAIFISSGIEWNDRIVDLDLSHNCFEEGGAQYIGKALMENRTIEKLNLSWNHIRRKGAVTISRALQSNKNITHLDISWNGFGYEGALAIGQALKRNRYLKELDISNNRINWAGAQFIANGLKMNETLEVFKIGLNPLTTTGAMDILESAGKPKCKLQVLDMTGVSVIGEFQFMASTLQHSKGLRTIFGNIVLNHDTLGERLNPPPDPMRKVIDMMTSQKLRPLEIFKNFDKEGLFLMGHGTFKDKLKDEMKKNNTYLTRGELDEVLSLMETKAGKEFGAEGDLNFVKLSQGVKEQKRSERMEKERIKKEKKKIREYHNKLLNIDEPDLPPEESLIPDTGRPLSALLRMPQSARDRARTPTTARSESVYGAQSLPSTPMPRPPLKVLSMSAPLGKKVKKGKKYRRK